MTAAPLKPSKLTRLYNAVLPFASIVENSSGRIPHERLSAADWHELVKAFRACDEVEAPDPVVAGLVAALEFFEFTQMRDGESYTETFERIAECFYRETGYLAPGKDCRLHDPDVRRVAWDKWRAEYLAKARAALSSAKKD